MRSTTTSSPGTAVTRTLSPPGAPLRRTATRTASFTRPGRSPAAPPVAAAPRVVWRWPGITKVMGVLPRASAMPGLLGSSLFAAPRMGAKRAAGKPGARTI